MIEDNKERIDLSQLSPEEEINVVAEICDKLNDVFDNNDLNDSDMSNQDEIPTSLGRRM